MAKKKTGIITTGDLAMEDHKTTVPPTGGMIKMDEKTQPKPFDWKRMERAAEARKKKTTTKK